MTTCKSDRKLPEKTARKRQSGENMAKVSGGGNSPVGSIDRVALEWKKKHLGRRLLSERKVERNKLKQAAPGLTKGDLDDLLPPVLLDHNYRNASMTAEECRALAVHLQRRFPEYEIHVTVSAQEKIDAERQAIRKRSFDSVGEEFFEAMAESMPSLFIVTPGGKSLFSERLTPRVLDLRRKGLWSGDPPETRKARLELRRLQLIESFNERIHLGGISKLLQLLQYQRDLAHELHQVLDELCRIQERPGIHCDVCGEEIPIIDKNGRPLPKRPQRRTCSKHTSLGRDLRRGGHQPDEVSRTAATEESVMSRFSNRSK